MGYSQQSREQNNEVGKIPFFRSAVNKITRFGRGKKTPDRVPQAGNASESSGTPELERTPKLDRVEADRADFGLKLFYDGDGAEVDIIAVHGLNGHREKTFTASNGICWLNSLLPGEISKIRVFSYGYDARTHGSSPLSREHLHGHAEKLLGTLTRKRSKTRTTKRPIIFVAHSLGGILVKSALILSNSFNTSHLEAQKAISLSTYGILFMGTPHAGGEGVTWGRLALNIASIVKHTNPERLGILERHSEWLGQQQVQYNSISSKFDTKFFYETYETPLPSGGKLLVVPRHSACIAGAINAELIAMSSDHSNMVKFKSAEDEGFEAVVEILEIMVQEAAQKIGANWKEWEAVKVIADVQKISYSIPMKLPFAINQRFTGRERELSKMNEVLQNAESRQRIVVLHGLGGMGKTQLAIQYAYSHEKYYDSVWWVNAKSTETLSQGYFGVAQELVSYYAKIRTSAGQKLDYPWIAAMLGVPPDSINEQGKFAASTDSKVIIEMVKSWLADRENRRWLLIIDNYDDLTNVKIFDFLPTNPSGGIIMTSRVRPAQRLGEGIEVEGIQEGDGVEILRKSALTKMEEFDKERVDAINIVRKLGALPLALDQAGAYINSMQISYGQYLSKLDGNFPLIAAKRPPSPTWQYREDTVFTTWEISFAALGPGAQQLLLLCGFLDNEDIWEGILLAERLKEDLGIDSVDDAIGEIFALSLAKRKTVSDSFWIHPMVHKWSHERLDRVEKERKASVAVSLASAMLSDNHYQNLALEIRLKPHLDVCFSHIVRDRYLEPVKSDLSWISKVEILQGVFWYHWQLGYAEELAQWVLAGREKSQGNDHPETLSTICYIADVFGRQGKYGDALEWYERALAGEEKILGKDHPSTLTTVHNMASVFDSQGKYDAALEWYERALAGTEKALGKDHPSTLTTVHSMASVFNSQGKYDAALEWYERALAGTEKALGKDHPSTLTMVHSMASVFNSQGKYDAALEWYERVLAGREKALGKDHPSTLATVHNMASVFGRQGKYDAALEWYERALAGTEKALGKDHPDMLATVHEMASVFDGQGKYDAALEWYERALAGREKALGKDHPDTLATVHGMAMVFDSQGKYDAALEWYERALAGREKALGKDHPDTLATVHGMAMVFDGQGKYDAALEWYERALAGTEKALGKDHPSTLATVHNMASVFDSQGKYDAALEWYERALAGKEKALGKDHPSTLATVHNMASVFGRQGKYDAALEWYEWALAGREKALGKDHPNTLATVHNMASVFDRQGKYDAALELFERALAGREKILGNNHPNTQSTKAWIAHVTKSRARKESGQLDASAIGYGLGDSRAG